MPPDGKSGPNAQPLGQPTEPHYEPWTDEHQVLHTPTHDKRCGKPFAPYMVGVREAEADSYCWGHDTEDAIKDAMHQLRGRLRAAHANLLGLAEGSGSRSEASRLRQKAQGVGLALSYVEEELR